MRSTLDLVLLILASTLSVLLLGSLGAVIFSERFMTGGAGTLTIILGTASTVFTALAGGAYFANYVRKANEEEANRPGSAGPQPPEEAAQTEEEGTA